MTWRYAVLEALRDYHLAHNTRVVERQPFVAEQLGNIVNATGSTGATPHQTLSRILQELRDEGLVAFLERGAYLLLDSPIDVESEDFSDEEIDFALGANRLRIGNVPTDAVPALARQRRGQDRIRQLITAQYGYQCAVCDITETRLLIASHIVGWAEAPEHRGDLANVICLCRPHDTLFEEHYWSLDDDFTILKRPSPSNTIRLLLDVMTSFHRPVAFPPATEFIRKHRVRAGFCHSSAGL